ncbi:unnamed protein product [Ranitomeya imitator]|uniref:Uncharacterized protein n=1 Tax=Ranitomeya imitator TaxID=111125 RepID=A0ABN9LR88_9NEOB|nr:unnamed protein product [Ranitomeya imitator]
MLGRSYRVATSQRAQRWRRRDRACAKTLDAGSQRKKQQSGEERDRECAAGWKKMGKVFILLRHNPPITDNQKIFGSSPSGQIQQLSNVKSWQLFKAPRKCVESLLHTCHLAAASTPKIHVPTWTSSLEYPPHQEFHQQLCQYEDHALRMIHEYFQDDLLHILENMHITSLLSELHARNLPDVTKYQCLENDRKTLARTLLQDIYQRGREAVIGLWVSLDVLRSRHGSPILDAVLDELRHRGDTLVEQIILDKYGHTLTSEIEGKNYSI